MKKLSKNRKIALVLVIVTIGLTVFIFSNSLTVGTESAKQSDVIVEIAESVTDTLGIRVERSQLSLIIRKLGHFSEYFLLGLAAAIGLVLEFESRKTVAFAPIYAFAVAVCDEFICQKITAGRSPQWTDVLIDMSGALLATFAVCLTVYILKKHKATTQKLS